MLVALLGLPILLLLAGGPLTLTAGPQFQPTAATLFDGGEHASSSGSCEQHISPDRRRS